MRAQDKTAEKVSAKGKGKDVAGADDATLRGDLVDRIERRRFVGREFLLWLWFESEVFEATLTLPKRGSFGLWVEGRLVLGDAHEMTTIKGSTPGNHREAKESLRRGKLPSLAGLHLSWGDHEATLVLKGESLAISGLKLPTMLDKANDEPGAAALALAPPPPRRRKKRDVEEEEREADDDIAEAFYERMILTREVESILVDLYRAFLTVRLATTWTTAVLPAIESWIAGDEIDVEAYRVARGKAAPPAGPGNKTRVKSPPAEILAEG